MIKYITGDLLEFPEGINTILHCANCKNTMGSGVALALRQKWPMVYTVDIIAAKSLKNTLGEISIAEIGSGKRVFNGYGQENYNRTGEFGRMINYEALYKILKQSHDILLNENDNGAKNVLGIPALLGCVRAGGDVRILNAMLDVIYGKSPLKVFVVEYNKK
jgi:hypothetical protein